MYVMLACPLPSVAHRQGLGFALLVMVLVIGKAQTSHKLALYLLLFQISEGVQLPSRQLSLKKLPYNLHKWFESISSSLLPLTHVNC